MSAREVIEAAGSNHAIGVTLNLAWGPNNSSPRNLHSVFSVFSTFSPYYHHFYLLFSFFPFQSSFLFRATLLIVIYILNPVVFSVSQKALTKTLFP